MVEFSHDLLGARVLIVDDEPANVMLLEHLLEEYEFRNVHSVMDSREVQALHMADPFDLILLDIRMPFLNGVDLLLALKSVPDVDFPAVLVLTAQTDDETRLQALAAGARDFVNKPFKHWEILFRIRNLLEMQRLFKDQRHRGDELEAAVRRRTRELEDTQRMIVERLGRAGEYRDNETGAHVIRMSHSCRLLAEKLGFPRKQAELISYAAQMHDVGKIGIPDAILTKPGRLDADERRVIETHVIIGADIIGEHDSELLQMARKIALSHHEKWDGSGYPARLKGEEIAIEARIAAVCDVFDALTSERPYKHAWSCEDAIGLLRAESGKHFDPTLVALFESILPEILALREKHPDAPAGREIEA